MSIDHATMPILLLDTGRSDSTNEVLQELPESDKISSVALNMGFSCQASFPCKLADTSLQECRNAVSNTYKQPSMMSTRLHIHCFHTKNSNWTSILEDRYDVQSPLEVLSVNISKPLCSQHSFCIQKEFSSRQAKVSSF
jgi:hypothetical protein